MPTIRTRDLPKPPRDYQDPRGCSMMHRPCPYHACRMHLGSETGPITTKISALPAGAPTCALDLCAVENDRSTVADALNISVEYVRLIEEKALTKLSRLPKIRAILREINDV